MRRLSVVFLVVLFLAPSAFGWGEDGHRIVCRIAYQSLSLEDRKEVDRLLKAYDGPPGAESLGKGFPEACLFADEARRKARDAEKANDESSPWFRFNEFNNWHFLNIPRDTRGIEESMCKDDCVLKGIAKHSDMLKNGASDQERAEGLIFIGHWIGDTHQPLHISFSDDQGGNKVEPVTGGFFPVPEKFPLNLHSVWDTAMLRKMVPKNGWKAYADKQETRIKDEDRAFWVDSKPLEWVQESYDVTVRPETMYCRWHNGTCEAFDKGRVLDAGYLQEADDRVIVRLQQAGARLAAVIADALEPEP